MYYSFVAIAKHPIWNCRKHTVSPLITAILTFLRLTDLAARQSKHTNRHSTIKGRNIFDVGGATSGALGFGRSWNWTTIRRSSLFIMLLNFICSFCWYWQKAPPIAINKLIPIPPFPIVNPQITAAIIPRHIINEPIQNLNESDLLIVLLFSLRLL